MQSVTDLSRFHRVCRHWRDVMADSMPLQQRTFLSPAPVKRRMECEYNPDLAAATGDGTGTRLSTKAEHLGIPTMVTCDLHPLLTPEYSIVTDGSRFTFGAAGLPQGTADTLRTMFLTQPPSTKVRIDRIVPGSKPTKLGRNVLHGTVEDQEGVRFGALIDKIRALIVERGRPVPLRDRLPEEAAALNIMVDKRLEVLLHSDALDFHAKGVVSAESEAVRIAEAVEEIERNVAAYLYCAKGRQSSHDDEG